MELKAESHCVVVGLGNPGQKYEFTRHNIGYIVAQGLAKVLGLAFKEDKRFQALVARGKYEGKTLHVILPLTYMNESGRAVGAYLNYYKLSPQDLIIIADDVELPFGCLRLRSKGGTGGHNGLKSIEAHIGTREYLRLKMGIGKELQSASLADYVLDLFKPQELEKLEGFVAQALAATKSLICEPAAAVMNKVNGGVGDTGNVQA